MSDQGSENNLVGTSFSLVRYSNPVLIDKKALSPSPSPTPTKSAAAGKTPLSPGGDAASESSSLATSKGAARSETEEILDSILPPREWEEEGQLWRQSVSSTPATRLDVINLQVREAVLRVQATQRMLRNRMITSNNS